MSGRRGRALLALAVVALAALAVALGAVAWRRTHPIFAFRVEVAKEVEHVAFGADGRALVLRDGKSVKIRRLENGAATAIDASEVLAVSDKDVVALHRSDRVEIVSIDGAPRATLRGLENARGLAFLPGPELLVAVAFERWVEVRDASDRVLETLHARASLDAAPRASASGRYLAAVGWGESKQLIVWERGTSRPMALRSEGALLGFSARGEVISLASDQRSIEVRSLGALGAPPRVICRRDEAILQCCVCASGERLAFVHRHDIEVRAVETDELCRRLDADSSEGGTPRLALSPDGDRLAVASPAGRVEIWEIPR